MVTRSISRPLAATRSFYIGVALGAVIIAFVGFWPTYFGPLLAGTLMNTPTLIHVHAAIFVGWLLIFVAQTTFAARGRIDLHIKLGKIGIGYGALVILVGLLATFSSFAAKVHVGKVAEAQGRLLGPLLDMAVFVPLFAAAVYYRFKPQLHKRLMIVATTALLIAAVTRMRFLGNPGHPALVMLVWTSPILLVLGYDFAKRRIVHPVYVLGLVLLLIESPMVRRLARGTETWQSISAWFVTFVN